MADDTAVMGRGLMVQTARYFAHTLESYTVVNAARRALLMMAKRLQQQLPNVLKQPVGRARLRADACRSRRKSVGFTVVVGRKHQDRYVA